MILIRDRDELRRHLEHLATMAEAEARATGRGYALQFVRGRSIGLRQAIEAISAWEAFESPGRPLIDVLVDD